MNIFDTILIDPLINLLVAIYHALVYFHIPGAVGFSIILSTALIRFILYPFTSSQIKTTQKMQELQPQMSKLKEKHKDNSKLLQQEQMALFKEHGVNPLGGCLPMIVQLVLLIGFYTAIMKVIAVSPKAAVALINKIIYFDFLKLTSPWDTNFFGLPLVKSPSDLLPTAGFVVFLIPVITVLFQLIQSKMMIPAKTDLVKQDASKVKKEPDFSQTIQTQMLYLTPVITGVVAFQFPIGLSLYWNTFTIFGIIQQYKVQGVGSLADWLKLIKWKI